MDNDKICKEYLDYYGIEEDKQGTLEQRLESGIKQVKSRFYKHEQLGERFRRTESQ